MKRSSNGRMKRFLCMGSLIDWVLRTPTVTGRITSMEVGGSCSPRYLCALRQRLDLGICIDSLGAGLSSVARVVRKTESASTR
jgi:hypothetical protein